MRVVIAEDQALLREGIVALLREQGIDVVAQAEDGAGLLRIVAGHKPDLAIVDVRLPPTFTDEGMRAALEARARFPGLGVLILSQYVEPVYTAELLDSGEGGIGYLLKERVGDVQGVRRRGRARRRAAARRSTARSSPSSCAGATRAAGDGALGGADAARARGARADGRGPHQHGDRARAGRHAGRGREAHLEHLQQARPARHRRRPPAGAGRSGLPAGGLEVFGQRGGRRRAR